MREHKRTKSDRLHKGRNKGKKGEKEIVLVAPATHFPRCCGVIYYYMLITSVENSSGMEIEVRSDPVAILRGSKEGFIFSGRIQKKLRDFYAIAISFGFWNGEKFSSTISIDNLSFCCEKETIYTYV